MTGREAEGEGGTARVLILAIIACIALQAWLAFVMEINWDEFFYLSHIHAFQSGELASVLQSFQVHLLGWVTAIPRDEIDRVEAGRLFMLACFTGTCALIYLLSLRFVSHLAALVAVLAFASTGYSIIHGASFRADPLAALLTMGSLVVIARARISIGSALAAGALAGVAGMVTVKVILYAPAFLGIAAWRFLTASDRRTVFLWLNGSALAAATSFAILYAIQLGLVPNATNAASRTGLSNAAETQTAAGLFPRLGEMRQFFMLSVLHTGLLLVGIGVSAAMLRDRARRPEAFALLGCAASLLCLIFYRNAYPYFFPFILAPAVVLVGVAVERFDAAREYGAMLVVALAAPALAVAVMWSQRDQRAQVQTIGAVHALFPDPVPYIDRNSMVASFPKRGFFMSTWGLRNYRRDGRPVFEDILKLESVPLLIANGPALQDAIGEVGPIPGALALLDPDKAILRDNYIHHWGPLWVAGKKLIARPEGTPFEILIPGTYTVEGAEGEVDGRAVRPGDTIMLDRGQHRLAAPAGQRLWLRWGNRLARPSMPFAGPVYRGFEAAAISPPSAAAVPPRS